MTAKKKIFGSISVSCISASFDSLFRSYRTPPELPHRESLMGMTEFLKLLADSDRLFI
jgi:hypothetical protein